MKRRDARNAGPNASEIRLRGELDHLRRELARLKKTPERDAGEAATHAGSTQRRQPESQTPPKPPIIETRVPQSAATFDLANERQAADGVTEIQRLRAQVAELTGVKQRLSRLYFNLLEENRKRQRRLRQLLDTVHDLASDPDVETWLRRFVESVRRGLGFEVMHVWMREAGTSNLILRASAGESAAESSTPPAMAIADLRATLRDEFRVSNSYFVSHGGRGASTLAGLSAPDSAAGPVLEWRDEDVLQVPLHEGDELVACLTLGRPNDGLVPSQEVVELLEIHVHLVAAALGTARLGPKNSRAQDEAEASRVDRDVRRLQVHFATTMSREMRTPILALHAHLDAMRERVGGEHAGSERAAAITGEVQRLVAGMGEETQRLSRLVDSILELDHTRPKGDRAEPVDLLELAHEAARLLEPVALAADVAVKVVAEAADTVLVADRDPIRHLALCVAGHAVQLAPPGGCVTLRVAGDETEIALEVAHAGPEVSAGVAHTHAPKVGWVDGPELGSCRAIVEQQGGRFEVCADGSGGLAARMPRQPRPRVLLRPEPRAFLPAKDILGLGIEMVAEVMDARVVSMLCPSENGDLVIHAAIGLDDKVVRDTRIRPGSGVAGWVAQNRRPVCVSGAEERSEITGSGRDLYRSRTFLSVPVEDGGELLGVLNVTDPIAAKQFGAEDCHLLLQLADCIAAAWRRALAARAGQAEADHTAAALNNAIRHLEFARRRAPGRVRLAREVGRALGMSEAEIGAMGFAASVHDIGRAAREPGSAGPPAKPEGDVSRPLEILGDVREMILSHHEWWDGSGYPAGLKGEEIPLGGRILAVVDAYEAMTLGRGSGEPMNRKGTVAELERRAGRQFDPKVVRACARALDEVESETAANEAAHAVEALTGTRR